jgi:cyanophycin synthetase
MIWQSESHCSQKYKDGWAILNADDEHCVKVGADLNCNVAYFSLDEDNS